MNRPHAYFLTWHTYGTWFHGDARGSVDRFSNAPGTPTLPPSPLREHWERRSARSPSLVLKLADRVIVEKAIRDHAQYRNWELFALAVRSNHVHVVVSLADISPERVLSEFKAWSTRRLRDAGCVARDQNVWVHHGSTRYLWKETEMHAAARYVLEAQDIERE